MAARDSGYPRGRMVPDTIKSTIAGQALVKSHVNGKSADSVIVYKPTGDSLKFKIGNVDTILNIFSLLNKDSVYEDSTVVRTPVGRDTIRQFYDSLRIESAGDARDTIRFLSANSIARDGDTEYKIFFRSVSKRLYAQDTVVVPVTGTTKNESGYDGIYINSNRNDSYLQPYLKP
jgi:hypothetical protein